MPGKRLNCYCGNCPACLRLMEQQRLRQSKVGCGCGVAACDCWKWDAKFEEKHGHEMRDYYSSSTARSAGSTLGGVSGLDLRGITLGAAGSSLANERDLWRRQLRGWARTAMARRGVTHA